MSISQEISIDIVKYLQEEKGQSIDQIAKNLSTTTIHIQEIIKKKSTLTSDNIDCCLKNQNIKFWEFIIKAIPIDHLSSQLRKKVELCKKLSDRIKKSKKHF